MKLKAITAVLMASVVIMLAAGCHSMPPVSAYSGTTVYVNPATINKYTNTTHVGDIFNVTLSFGNMTNLFGIQYALYWNNSLLKPVKVHDVLPWSGGPFTPTNTTTENYNATCGQMIFISTSTTTAFTGSAAFRTITFNITSAPTESGSVWHSAIAWGNSTEVIFGDMGAQSIPLTTYDGEFSYSVITVPEYAPLMMLIALMFATSFVTIVYRKKC